MTLRWYRTDLHIHTPASRCFEDKSVTPQDIVRRAIDQRLDMIAITDHNTGEWIDKIKEAARGTELTVIPGVEITCGAGKDSGIHLIALFDTSWTSRLVDTFMGTIKIPGDTLGSEDAVSPLGVPEVITEIAAAGGLPVLAHANSSHGVLHDMKGKPRDLVIDHPDLLAAEGTDFDNEDKARSGRRTVDLLNGSSGYRKLAVYQASDNPGGTPGLHGLVGIGSRVSHLKMGAKSLEGLRQCFSDPDVRIRFSPQAQPTYPYISSVSISDGFLGGQTVVFSAGLNSILGGKGVGKSALFEFLRFGLNQASQIPDIAKDHQGKLKKLLPLGSNVTIEVSTAGGQVYRIQRTHDGFSNPSVVLNVADGTEYTGDLSALFPVLAYSQTEVLHIANNENAQLRLIDQFFDSTDYAQRIQINQEELSRNDDEISKSLLAMERLSSLNNEKSTIAERVKQLDRQLQSELFAVIRTLERRRTAAKGVLDTVKHYLEEVRSLQKRLLVKPIPSFDQNDMADERLSEVRIVALQAEQAVQRCLDEAIALLELRIADIESRREEWEEYHRPSFEEYQQVLREAGGDYHQLDQRRKAEATKLERLDQQITDAKRNADALPGLMGRREELLDQLDSLHQALFSARERQFKIIQEASGGKLRLSLTHASNRTGFQGELTAQLRGSGARSADIERVTGRLSPRQFGKKVAEQDIEGLSKAGGIAAENARRFVSYLTSEDRLTPLLALQHSPYPEDVPLIEFRKDDGEYYPLQELSVGQKSTALLIIALVQGEMPVLIDQPEDSLDIPSVWEDIVLKLRLGKESRQFILTTHNSSVAVASDSEQFLVVTSSSSQARVTLAGGIDIVPVRQSVIQHLEGGKDSYHLKRRKYNL